MLSRSISTSVSIESMSEWAQLLFDRIVIWSDDYGRIEGDPRVLKGTAKPLSERTPADFAEAVAEMVKVGAIAAYVAGGRVLLHVVRNDEHQRVSKKTPSRYQDPADFVAIDAAAYLSAVVNGVPREISGNLGKSEPREEKRREVKGREENTPCSPPQAGGAEPTGAEAAGERNEPVAAGEETEPKRTRKKTASQISPEWRPSAEWIARLEAECPAIDLERVVPEFRDYWIGEGKPKADWERTFANRVRAINADISSGNRRAIAGYGRGGTPARPNSHGAGNSAAPPAKPAGRSNRFGQLSAADIIAGRKVHQVPAGSTGGPDDPVPGV